VSTDISEVRSLSALHDDDASRTAERLDPVQPVDDELAARAEGGLEALTDPTHVPATGTQTDARRRPSGFDGWVRRYVAVQIVLDAAGAMASVALTLLVRNRLNSVDAGNAVVAVLGAALAWPLAVALSGGYVGNKITIGDHELRAVLQAVTLAITAGAIPSAALGSYTLMTLSVVAVPAAGAFSLMSRLGARRHLRQQQRAGRHLRRVVLVGGCGAVSELHHVLERDRQHGMSVSGVFVPQKDVDRARLLGLGVLGDLDEVAARLRDLEVDAVAVTGGPAMRQGYLRQLSWALEGERVELLVHPGLVEVAGPRMHIRPYVGLPLLHVEQPHFSGWRRVVKRVADLVLTSLGVLITSPLLLGIAAAIKLEGKGPVFFKQTRVGLDGSLFTMWKFRSMHIDAEERLADPRRREPAIGLMFKMREDPRVTRVGRVLRKFSLDELPQLFNILGGSMSLVGPRPPLPSEVDAYEHHARRRLLVTPGLTGLWQVSGRSLLSWEETVRLDLRYVENWTLSLDLLILWKTIFAVLARRGAF